jgi:ADP-L-glycero-D-manno-heptose 6-epimerase
MIILTGAGGFIGSVMLGYLNRQGITDILIVDGLPNPTQYRNLVNKKYVQLLSPDCLQHLPDRTVTAVIHLGAISNTLETDWSTLYYHNVLATRKWSEFCKVREIPFIFASSAGLYGNGDGPLSQYAFSKQVSENDAYGMTLRLFNVYGPNEYHKGNMASVIYQWYKQLQHDDTINLFYYSAGFFRDFIWVEDVAATIFNCLNNYQPGIYDVGTGVATHYEQLGSLVISAYGSGKKKYIRMPGELSAQYQTHTCANLTPLVNACIPCNFTRIEDGVLEYAKYLCNMKYY